MKKKYESMFIVNQSGKEKVAETIEKVKKFITEKKGTVLEIVEWGTKKLAYEIEHQDEGYYVVAYFTLGSNHIAELEKFYKLDEKIIRFIIIHQQDKK